MVLFGIHYNSTHHKEFIWRL